MLLKPQKYINLSGEVIKKFVDYYKVDINDILIINDDLDLEIGNFKLKPTGSSAGHNGLKNIELMLGTQDYKRLKIGISNNKQLKKFYSKWSINASKLIQQYAKDHSIEWFNTKWRNKSKWDIMKV